MIFDVNSPDVLTLNSLTTTAGDRATGLLIVDDDFGIRSILSQLLRDDGYTVFQAGDGEEAREIWNNNRSFIDVVLCDFSLPDTNGAELVETMREERPDVKIIFMSGLFPPEVMQRAQAGEISLMEKPFNVRSLSATIEGLMRERVAA